MFSRGQLHQQCCEEWTLVSEETQAKMARMAAAAAWGLGNRLSIPYQVLHYQWQNFLRGTFRLASVTLGVLQRDRSLDVDGNSRGERRPVKTLTYRNVKWWRKAAASV